MLRFWTASPRLLIACLVCLILHLPAQAQLNVLPTAGKSLGCVTAPEPGKWLVFGPDSLKFVQPTILEGGKIAIFEGAPGLYAVCFIPPGDTAQPLVANVTLGAADPPPGPGPGPGPEPGPDPPLTGLSKQVRDWATTLVPSNARLKCQAVAQSFSTVASQIGAGTLAAPSQIIAVTTQANRESAGATRDDWLPFFEQLRKYLNTESQAGRLATPEQHRVTWLAIAQGLEAVR